MNNKLYIKISIITILLIVIILFSYKFVKIYEHYSHSLKWSSLSFCLLSDTINDVLKENQLYYTPINNDWILYIPCNYESVNTEYNNVPVKNNAMYFFIDDSDYMIAKEELWKNIVKIYGEDEAITMIPKTYLIDNDENIKKFKKEYSTDKLYIMKKNIQRQEGLKIISSLEQFLDIMKDNTGDYKYMLIQELLQNPYLISGRKINLRIYVLVVCKGDDYDIYMYNDGFMYYTADKFKKNSEETGPNITTGYIDRKVYAENPLTHADFREYLDSNRQLTRYESIARHQHGLLSVFVFNNIQNLISKVFKSYHHKIGKNKKLLNNIKFQLFGADVAISDDLNAQIMEINKGPDLGAKDKRDSELKHNLVRDMFKILNINKDNNNNNNFIKVN
jgi:hypothetical protein